MLTSLALLQLVASPGSNDDAFTNRVTPEVLVVQSAGPAVVYIKTNVVTRQRDILGRLFYGEQQGSGSGVVIYEDGFIVTNNHVIEGAERIEVQFDPSYDDAVYPARLISNHPAEDLALLKIEGPEPFPTIPPGRSDDLMIGERVLAIGNPYGQTHTVSAGIISGLHRNVRAAGIEFQNLIQTDASINPGNSGGPLLNINGELIGINTAMNTAAENIGFAIPVDHVREVLEEYLLSPDYSQVWLGFDVDLGQLRVSDVVAGGPADLAGLRPGDRVLDLNGRPVADEEEYRRRRLALQPDQEVQLRVQRGQGTHDVRVQSLGREDGIVYERAGVQVQPIVLGFRRPVRTLEVTAVRPGGPGERLGLRPGDILDTLQPDGAWRTRQLRDAKEFAVLLTRLRPGTRLRLEVWRDENDNGRLERGGDYSELFKGALTLE